jgi:hypothetical protein
MSTWTNTAGFDFELRQRLEWKYQPLAGSEAVLFIPHRVFAVSAQESNLPQIIKD